VYEGIFGKFWGKNGGRGYGKGIMRGILLCKLDGGKDGIIYLVF
jgi:hypothetical protein